MKVVEVRSISEFLSKLKLNKFSKEIRVNVLKNYAELTTANKEIDAKMEELRKKVFTDEELQELQDAINNKTEVSQTLIDKNNEYNEVILKMFNDDCEVKVVKISEEKFIDCLVDSEVEFTPVDILRLKPILK